MDPLQAFLEVILNMKLDDPTATKTAMDMLSEYIKKLKEQTKAEDEATKALKEKAKKYDENAQVLDTYKRGIDKVIDGLAQLGAAFGAQAITIGASLTSFQEYNKALVANYQSTTRGAMSGREYKATLDELRDSFGGTYAEATKLLAAYEQAYINMDAKKMQADLDGIRKIVGDNQDAMAEFLNQIGQVGAAFPEFQQFMETFTMGEIKERAQDLMEFATNAALAGKLSREQIKFLTALAQGGAVEEDPQLKAANEVIKAQQQVRKTFEDIANYIGAKILPIVQSVAGFIVKWGDYIGPFVIALTVISVGLGTVIGLLGVAKAAVLAFGVATNIAFAGIPALIGGAIALLTALGFAIAAGISNANEQGNEAAISAIEKQNRLDQVELSKNKNLSEQEKLAIEDRILDRKIQAAKIRGEDTAELELERKYLQENLGIETQKQNEQKKNQALLGDYAKRLLEINQRTALLRDDLEKASKYSDAVTRNAKSLRDVMAGAGMGAKEARDITEEEVKALYAKVDAQKALLSYVNQTIARGKAEGPKNVTAEQISAAKKLYNEQMLAAGEDEAQKQLAMKTLTETVGFANSQLEIMAQQKELQAGIRDELQKEADIKIQALKMSDVALQTKEKEYAVTEAMTRLTDSLGMGLGAQMKTRMDQLAQLGEQIQLVRDKQTEAIRLLEEERRKQASLSGQELIESKAMERKYQNELLDANRQLLDIDQKRADVAKTMREGWLGALTAMISGQGVFARIVISEDQNLGILAAKRQDQIKALGLGGESTGGGTASSRMTVGGYEAGKSGKFREDILSSYGVSESKTTQQNVQDILAVQEKMLQKVSTGAASFGQGPNTAAINLGDNKTVTVISNAGAGVPNLGAGGGVGNVAAPTPATIQSIAPVVAAATVAALNNSNAMGDGSVPSTWIYDELVRIRNATEESSKQISTNISADLQTLRVLYEKERSEIGTEIKGELSDMFKEIGGDIIRETIKKIRESI